MDSRDPSSQPPYAHLQHLHGMHPPLPAHHSVVMIPHSQTQHYSSGDSYVLPNANNSVSPTTAMMHQQNPRFPFNPISAAAVLPKEMDHHFPDGPPGRGGGGLGSEPAKKKRGRPRKYSPDNSIGLALSSAPGSQVSPAASHLESGGALSSDTPAKRSRGRPPGSGKKQLNALGYGVTGVGFTPHVLMVNTGEDIVSRIMSFSQQGPRTVLILSATGAVCNVTLGQTSTSSTSVKYEGHFEIVCLCGTFTPSESDDTQNQNVGLSVSLSGSDGRVFGGRLTGTCEAATPVQIIVGSFTTESKKGKTSASSSAPQPSNLPNFNIPVTEANPSGGSSDSAEDNEDSDTLNRGHGSYSIMQGMPTYDYSTKMHPSN